LRLTLPQRKASRRLVAFHFEGVASVVRESPLETPFAMPLEGEPNAAKMPAAMTARFTFGMFARASYG